MQLKTLFLNRRDDCNGASARDVAEEVQGPGRQWQVAARQRTSEWREVAGREASLSTHWSTAFDEFVVADDTKKLA